MSEGRATTIPVEAEADIADRYRGTPIGTLLAFHNLGRRPPEPPAPRLVIVACRTTA